MCHISAIYVERIGTTGIYSVYLPIFPPQGSSLYLCNTPGPQVVAQFAIRYKKVLQSASDLTRWLQQSHSINIQKIFQPCFLILLNCFICSWVFTVNNVFSPSSSRMQIRFKTGNLRELQTGRLMQIYLKLTSQN